MFDKISRRDMFTGKFVKLLLGMAGTRKPDEEYPQRDVERYFQSSIYSYPLLQEMPWDLLTAEAEMHGIPVHGREKNEIVRDLFLKVMKRKS